MKKVLIIGAGPAGLTAAYELMKRSKEYEVLILEETESIGGISRTVMYNGNYMDMGGHRFFSKDERVVKWWHNILPVQGEKSYDDIALNREVRCEKDGPNPEIEDRVMLRRKRVSRIYYNNKFFDYPINLNIRTLLNLGFFTSLHIGFDYLHTLFFKRKEKSLEDFYINRFGKKLYCMFFKDYTEKLWGYAPSSISADWGKQRVKGVSIIAVIKDYLKRLFRIKNEKQETSLIEEFEYPKYGPGQLWEKVADEFSKMGGTIIKNCEVKKIQTKHNRIIGLEYIKDNKVHSISGDIVISSMPLNNLVLGIEKLPDNIKKIAQGLPYRDYVTVGLLLDKIVLKNKTKMDTINNIIPDCWIYVQDNSVDLGRIQIYNNWSPYLVKNIDNQIWIGLEYFCKEEDKIWCLNTEQWKLKAIEELTKLNIINEECHILDIHIEKVKKAYPAYFDTYSQIDKIISYVDKYDNLYCVGRNGQHRYNNMDHSMMTAFTAVDCILGKNTDKSEIWKVNCEQEYHEKK